MGIYKFTEYKTIPENRIRRKFNNSGASQSVLGVTTGQSEPATNISSNEIAYCQTVTTSNDTLNGLSARNGYTPTDGDQILVKNQTDSTTNGVYLASAGDWVKSDIDLNLVAYIQILDGNFKTLKYVLSDRPVDIGTDSVFYTRESVNYNSKTSPTTLQRLIDYGENGDIGVAQSLQTGLTGYDRVEQGDLLTSTGGGNSILNRSFTEIEIELTTSQILNLDTTDILIDNFPSGVLAYVIGNPVFKFDGGTAYTVLNDSIFIRYKEGSNEQNLFRPPADILQTTTAQYGYFNPVSITSASPTANGGSLIISANNSITGGSGNLTIKLNIRYITI